MGELSIQIETLKDQISVLASSLQVEQDANSQDWVPVHVRLENVMQHPARRDSIWVNRGSDTAKQISDEFIHKVARENFFKELTEKARARQSAESDSERDDEKHTHFVNLLGYMLTKMTWHSDMLMENLLQKLLETLSTELSD